MSRVVKICVFLEFSRFFKEKYLENRSFPLLSKGVPVRGYFGDENFAAKFGAIAWSSRKILLFEVETAAFLCTSWSMTYSVVEICVFLTSKGIFDCGYFKDVNSAAKYRCNCMNFCYFRRVIQISIKFETKILPRCLAWSKKLEKRYCYSKLGTRIVWLSYYAHCDGPYL